VITLAGLWQAVAKPRLSHGKLWLTHRKPRQAMAEPRLTHGNLVVVFYMGLWWGYAMGYL